MLQELKLYLDREGFSEFSNIDNRILNPLVLGQYKIDLRLSLFPVERMLDILTFLPDEELKTGFMLNDEEDQTFFFMNVSSAVSWAADLYSFKHSGAINQRFFPLAKSTSSGDLFGINMQVSQFTSDAEDVWCVLKEDETLEPVELSPPSEVGLEAMRGTVREHTIRGVFNDATENCRFDKQWLSGVLNFIHRYRLRSEEHIAFLGGNSIGTHKLLWTKLDEIKWWELLEVDDFTEVRKAYHKVAAKQKDFAVAGNVTNVSFPYVCHRIYNEESLTDNEKEKGVLAVMSLMHYQFLSSLFRSSRFKYGASDAVSQGAFASLTRKSLLKQHGSWEKLVQARSIQIASPDSKHYSQFLSFSNDDKVIYIVTDTQTAIRRVVNRLTSAYMDTHAADSRIMTASSTFTDGEGNMVFKDVIGRADKFTQKALDLSIDPHALIHARTLSQSIRIVPSSDERYLREALLVLVERRRGNKQDAEQLIRELSIFIEDYLRSAPENERTIVHIIMHVVNMMRSSQVTNDHALVLKDLASDITNRALKRSPATVQASCRIALVTYLTVRVLTYNE